MKKNILLIMVSVSSIVFSQKKMITKSGTITFEASVPSFEEVKATNYTVTFVLNPATGEIASLALIKGFEFKIALMEEHFNENFIESDQFPKAIFKGKIEDFDVNSLTAHPKDFVLKGQLELHGITKDINIMAKISRTSLVIKLSSNFSVNASDFNIQIPAVVKYKLMNKVTIKMASVFKL
jgi:hypothetical protein